MTGILEPYRPQCGFGTEIYDIRGTFKVDRLLYMITGDLIKDCTAFQRIRKVNAAILWDFGTRESPGENI